MTAKSVILLLVCLLTGTAAAWASDSLLPSPLVTASDTSHPSANADAPILAMPPGTLGAPKAGDAAGDNLSPRPPITDVVAVPPVATKLPPVTPDTQPSANNPANPVAPAVSAVDQQALRRMVQEARDSIVTPIKPPPPKITVKPGVTEMIPISMGRLNRFITPFQKVEIRTDSDDKTAQITEAGNVIYVTTDSSEAISLFAFDEADPLQAISLTLTPAGIPPVQVDLTLAGYEPKPAPPIEKSHDKPGEMPYVEAIKSLMRALALHHIPDGYAMLQIAKVPRSGVPRCNIPNVDVHVAQVLEGHAMTVFVARAVNTSLESAEIDESECGGDTVLAVAAWPRAHLEPGQDTELYIVTRRVEPGESPPDRPSVLRGGY
jgi:conjugal transfer pilus assembly protein TraK